MTYSQSHQQPEAITAYSRADVAVSTMDGTVLQGNRYDLQRQAPNNRRKVAANKTPLLCIPPELGNTGFYDKFVAELAGQEGAPEKVITMDLRGRGRSELGKDRDTTTVTDADDIISICDALGLHHADVLVTGRATLAVLLTAPKRPGMFRRLVLNDGGPEFDTVGIARLTTAGKRAPDPRDWDDAIKISQTVRGDGFTAFSQEDWDDLVRTIWKDVDGKPVPNHDKGLKRLSNTADYDAKQPLLWEEHLLFKSTPTLLIRGENSELITPELADRILKDRRRSTVITASGQGHAPVLHLPSLPADIARFLSSAD